MAGSVFAAELAPPPTGLPDDAAVFQTAPNVPNEFAASFHIGPNEIVLEETLLAQVRESIGVGKIAHRGDAGDSIYWLCYTINADRGRQRIWISSNELHGGKEVSEIDAELVSGAEGAPKGGCPILPAGLTPILIGKDVWLGLRIEEIERRIGAKAKRSGRYFVFSFAGKALIPREDKKDEFDVQNDLVIEARKGRAVRLWTWKSTTD